MKLVPKSSPALWTPTDAVISIEAEVLPYVQDMLQLCRVSGGLALAAPQVGIAKSFFVIGARQGRPELVVVNPSITLYGDARDTALEGCLSNLGEHAEVTRSKSIIVTFTDGAGKRFDEVLLEGLEARVFQHEYDHLLGRCIFSRPTTAQ